MKKRYTKKQIAEAIAYWKKQLAAKKYICESEIDAELLDAKLREAAQDKIEEDMPEDIKDICKDIVENFVYNHSDQMLKEFAENHDDVAKGRETKEWVYEHYFSEYENPDATSLYAACNGNLDQLKNNVEIVTATTTDENDYDFKSVTVEFRYNGKTYHGIDVWYSGNRANDDQDEFQHCSEDELDDVIDWIDNENQSFIELPADALQCIKGKYILKSDLLDILEYMLVDDNRNDIKYVKIT